MTLNVFQRKPILLLLRDSTILVKFIQCDAIAVGDTGDAFATDVLLMHLRAIAWSKNMTSGWLQGQAISLLCACYIRCN